MESFSEAYGRKALPGRKLTSQDMTVLLKYLQRDRRILLVDKDVSRSQGVRHRQELTYSRYQAIKILAVGEQGATGISEAERGILQVKSTSAALESQISDLESRIAE